jgi:intein/homing endonuclease
MNIQIVSTLIAAGSELVGEFIRNRQPASLIADPDYAPEIMEGTASVSPPKHKKRKPYFVIDPENDIESPEMEEGVDFAERAKSERPRTATKKNTIVTVTKPSEDLLKLSAAPTLESVETTIEPQPQKENKATAIATGCIPCVPPGSLVWCNPKAAMIENIKTGDKVIDSNGELVDVVHSMSREYEGDLISVTLPGQNKPLNLTPNHSVLAIEAHWCPKRKMNKICYPKDNPACDGCTESFGLPKWVPAEELTATGKTNTFTKHMLLMPIFSEMEDVEAIDVFKITPKAYAIRNPVKEIVLVNKDFMKLIGYYLAEGHVSVQRGGVIFSFGKTEKDLAEEVLELLKKVFGSRSKIYKTDTSLQVGCNSITLGHFLVNLVGKGAHNKFIPLWMLKLPPDKQLALIHGYWNGDGCEYISYNREVMSASTVSPDLAYSLRLILHRLGILHNLAVHKTKTSFIKGREIKSGSDQYIFQLNSNDTHKLKVLMGLPSEYRFVQSSQYGLDDKWVYLPIKKVEKTPYKGPVFNLETGTHNYCVGGIIVKNCSLGHVGTCSGLLNEATRFARGPEGAQSPEVIDRVNMCLDELNSLEREDLRPEKVTQLTGWERDLADKVLNASRATRHKLEDVTNINTRGLEQIASETQTVRQQIGREWFQNKIAGLTPADQESIKARVMAKLTEMKKQAEEEVPE